MYETVLPSSLLEFAEDSYFSSFAQSFQNTALRIGIVKSISKIEDERNVDKRTLEYDVLTFQQDKDKGIVPITYKNCVTMDSFGGIADFFEFVKSSPTTPNSTDMKVEDGSYVLLLCIDGTSTRGVIIGALPHHNRKSTLKNLKDKHLESEYNGLRMKINDDGELTITFKGKTDKKGKPTTTTGGSQIKIEKDGSLEINDRDLDGDLKAGNDLQANDTSKAGDDFEKIRIDKTKKAIELNSRTDFTQTIGANSSETIKGNKTTKATDLVIELTGKANISAKSVIDIKTDGEMKAKASNGNFDFDDALKILASSVNINAQTIILGAGGTSAVINTTLVATFGNLGIPIIGTMIGPFSTTVFIAP